MVSVDTIIQAIEYVVTGLFFWQAMAMVTILAMMIGSTICNGDFKSYIKATILIISYSSLLLLTSLARIIGNNGLGEKPELTYQALAGVTTIILITLFYLIGLFLGVYAHNRSRKGRG